VAGGVLVAVVVAAVLAVALVGGGSAKPKIPADALPGAAAVRTLLSGIPQRGDLLGSPTAPVRVVEYADVQCPYCRDAELHAIQDVISRYVRTGKASLELRLIDTIGPDSSRGRQAALAAGLQGKLFDLTELLYRNQGTENTGWLTSSVVRSAAGSVPGLDVDRLVADMGSQSVVEQEREINAAAAADNVTDTPTFLVGPRDGSLQRVTLSSLTDVTSLPAAIDKAGP
jgi:protein-disulfide isomerase